MNDTFYEQIVSRSTGALAMVLRIVIYVFLVVLVLLSLLRVPLAFFIVIPLAGLSFYYVIPRLSVEYEYALLNSELNIDVIFSKSSRKHILTIDLREAEKSLSKVSPRYQSLQKNINVAIIWARTKVRPMSLSFT